MKPAEWFRSRRPQRLYVAIDEGQGVPVVLVHGIASSHVTFENVTPLLRESHRVIAVDLLGFGRSGSPAGARFTPEEHVAALARTISHLDLRERFVLVGHSMGSLIAARYAATHPAALAGVVLVSPPIYLPPETVADPVERAAMTLYRRVYDFLRRRKSFTMRNAALLARLSPIKNVLDISDRNWTAFVLSLQNSVQSQTAIADIATTDVPIQVVYGTMDPFLVPGAVRIVERMRHVTTHRVAGGDHLIRKRTARVVATAVGALSEKAT